MTEREFLEVVEAVCKRPRLYTPAGTFFEVVSFLDGLGIGANVRPPNQLFHATFTPFSNWLTENRKLSSQAEGWCEKFLEQFGSDRAAIAELQQLYAEYVAATENEQNLADADK